MERHVWTSSRPGLVNGSRHRMQARDELLQPLATKVFNNAVGEGCLLGGDPLDRRVSRLRRRQERRPFVGGVRERLEKPVVSEAVCDPLHRLAGDAHLSCHTGRCQGFMEHCAQHLPPGDSEPYRSGKPLARRQHLPVQLEDAKREVAGEARIGFHDRSAISPKYPAGSCLPYSAYQWSIVGRS